MTAMTKQDQYRQVAVQSLFDSQRRGLDRFEQVVKLEQALERNGFHVVRKPVRKPKAAKKVQNYGPKDHPETGEWAPDGYFWARNAMSGNWFLEAEGTPFSASAASEAYWSS